MSLDISLVGQQEEKACICSECGNEHKRSAYSEAYSGNITHNLGLMAKEAGIYHAMWRPEEIGATQAKDITELLRIGLERLKSRPEHFQQYDAKNGWGTYKDFVPFVEEYLNACISYPESHIEVSR